MPRKSTPLQAVGTRLAFPAKARAAELRWSRKGRQLADAMRGYAAPRLLPKLQARPGQNQHNALDVLFADACVYLRSWLGTPDLPGVAEFPFARLYPVRGGRYNVAVRRLVDWVRAEDSPLTHAIDAFWLQAPNAKFWVKIGEHRTLEEAIDLLVQEPTF